MNRDAEENSTAFWIAMALCTTLGVAAGIVMGFYVGVLFAPVAIGGSLGAAVSTMTRF